MTSFAIRVDYADAGHVRCTVFAGPDAEHRASTGTLVLLPAEFHDLTNAFKAEVRYANQDVRDRYSDLELARRDEHRRNVNRNLGNHMTEAQLIRAKGGLERRETTDGH